MMTRLNLNIYGRWGEKKICDTRLITEAQDDNLLIDQFAFLLRCSIKMIIRPRSRALRLTHSVAVRARGGTEQ